MRLLCSIERLTTEVRQSIGADAMAIVVESKRKKAETLVQHYPDACILDVTSRSTQPWVKFSPFYPHGSIPVPLDSAS